MRQTIIDLQASRIRDVANAGIGRSDVLAFWFGERGLGRFCGIGTLYTRLAGRLNVLVVYDAWSGPMHPTPRDGKDKQP